MGVIVEVKKKVGRPKKVLTIIDTNSLKELENKIKELSSWGTLTDLEKRIILLHVMQPQLPKQDLAKGVGCTMGDVWQVFNNPKFVEISIEIAKQETKELVQLAVKTVRELLLGNKFPNTRLNTAMAVLNNVGVLVEGTNIQDQKFEVSWQEDSGNKNKVSASSETVRSSSG